MKLDPKYFNLFIACCTIVALLLIAYGTIAYHQKQEKRFLDNVGQTDLDSYFLPSMTEQDSLGLSSFEGAPVVIHFWSTWSRKSQNVHSLLHELVEMYPELTILAAAIRDDDELVQDYIRQNRHPFIYVNGTPLYHDLQVPGLPSQILLDRDGRYYASQIGEDDEKLKELIEFFLDHERE